MKKQYGEFKCPHCDQVFFEKKKLDGHIGGAHKRNITKDIRVPKCKFCGDSLVEGKNWPKWAVKQRNLICIKCKRVQNRTSYRNKLESKVAEKQAAIDRVKEKITYAT
jgi:uncharacterized C2H2 Zn-finger protein